MPITHEDAASIFHEGGSNASIIISWETYVGGRPVDMSLNLFRYEDTSDIHVTIMRTPGAPETAQASPSPSSAPSAAPSGVSESYPAVMDCLWEVTQIESAADYVEYGLDFEESEAHRARYSMTREFNGYPWSLIVYTNYDIPSGMNIEYESDGGHEAAAKAFADGYAFFTERYGPHDYLGYEEDDGVELTLDDVLQWFLPGEPHFVIADWMHERDELDWKVSFSAYLEEDGSFGVSIDMYAL